MRATKIADSGESAAPPDGQAPPARAARISMPAGRRSCAPTSRRLSAEDKAFVKHMLGVAT